MIAFADLERYIIVWKGGICEDCTLQYITLLRIVLTSRLSYSGPPSESPGSTLEDFPLVRRLNLWPAFTHSSQDLDLSTKLLKNDWISHFDLQSHSHCMVH